jgi:hypothetical protein
VERAVAAAGPDRHRVERHRPPPGAAARPRTGGHRDRSALCERSAARDADRAADRGPLRCRTRHRCRPARAQLRHLRGPTLGRSRGPVAGAGAALARTQRRVRSRRRRGADRLLCALRRQRDATGRAPSGPDDRARRARRRARLPVPRRGAHPAAGAKDLAAWQRKHQPAALQRRDVHARRLGRHPASGRGAGRQRRGQRGNRERP